MWKLCPSAGSTVTLALTLSFSLTLLTALPAGAQDHGDTVGRSRRSADAASGWTTYVTPSAATAVEYPAGLFSRKAGPFEKGSGDMFRTADSRAQLIVYDLPNPKQESPRSYLGHHLIVRREEMDYRRVTDRFFAVSGIKDGLTFYSRCNFSGGRGTMHCIYLAYPQSETRAWDRVVTRISLSLRERQRAEARRPD